MISFKIIFNFTIYICSEKFYFKLIIFIRDFTKLKNFSDQDLLKTSLILHDMYDSYDLCHLLLSEYDKRNKKDLHQKYSKMLGKFKLELKFMNLKTDIDSITSNS